MTFDEWLANRSDVAPGSATEQIARDAFHARDAEIPQWKFQIGERVAHACDVSGRVIVLGQGRDRFSLWYVISTPPGVHQLVNEEELVAAKDTKGDRTADASLITGTVPKEASTNQ